MRQGQSSAQGLIFQGLFMGHRSQPTSRFHCVRCDIYIKIHTYPLYVKLTVEDKHTIGHVKEVIKTNIEGINIKSIQVEGNPPLEDHQQLKDVGLKLDTILTLETSLETS